VQRGLKGAAKEQQTSPPGCRTNLGQLTIPELIDHSAVPITPFLESQVHSEMKVGREEEQEEIGKDLKCKCQPGTSRC